MSHPMSARKKRNPSTSLSLSLYQFKFFLCIKRDVDKLILFKRENKEFPVFPANQEPPDKMDFREKEDRQEKTETTYELIQWKLNFKVIFR